MSHTLPDLPENPDLQPQGDDNRKIAIAIGVQIMWLILIAGILMLISSHFPIANHLVIAQRRISEIELWGAVLHVFLFAFCNVLLLPGGVLAVGAGLFFGLWTGWLLNIAGSVLGAALSFLIARKLGRIRLITRFLNNNRWKQLETGVQKEGWKIVFFSQLHPLFPTSLLNYLYGLTPIRFSTCLLWIGLGQAPGLFLYAYIGTMTQRGLSVWNGTRSLNNTDWLMWGIGLMATLSILTILGRISLRIIKENDPSDTEISAI